MAATLTITNKVTSAGYSYADTGVEAAGTFSASGTTVTAITGEITGLGEFSATTENDALVYTLEPAAIADSDDLATAAAAIVAAIEADLA